jgi:hypothetical protein
MATARSVDLRQASSMRSSGGAASTVGRSVFGGYGDHLAVCDLRPSASASLSILDAIDRAICQASDSIADRSQIARTCGRALGNGGSPTRPPPPGAPIEP